ncbi:hypothetical protein MLD38_018138 [Melastoma candidum]|uniref:Uncharacterized protein n=1 Tax=Melastoma candidum TaxID=119954 RepID=A0ACB9QWE3_9MYRT|nr:hypothetical protein MLD38_018138 [Melastoma candidum]
MSAILSPFQLLELHIISAQDLRHVSRNMRPYAIIWIHPERKLSTSVDPHGKTNPTWNDRFVFKVDEEFLLSETSAVTIEIYSVHWLKDILVGSVRVLIGNLLPPHRQSRGFRRQRRVGLQFAALQIRRPSGRPQGIINVGISLLDSSKQSMPLYSEISTSLTVTTGTNLDQPGSMVNGGHDEKLAQVSHGDTSLPAGGSLQPVLRRSKSESSTMDALSDGSKLKRKVSFRERLHSIISASEGSSSQDPKLIKGSSSTPASMVNGYYVSHPNENTNPDKARKSSKASTVSGSSGGRPGVVKITELNSDFMVVDLTDPKNGDLKQSNLKKVISESDLGASPSEVAADTSVKERHPYRPMAPPLPDDTVIMEGSVVSMSESMEGLQSKLERWRMELPPIYDRSEVQSFSPSMNTKGGSGHGRRHPEGATNRGLFSCFSNICGCECSIVCDGGGGGGGRGSRGGKNKTSSPKGRSNRGRRSSHSPTSESFL